MSTPSRSASLRGSRATRTSGGDGIRRAESLPPYGRAACWLFAMILCSVACEDSQLLTVRRVVDEFTVPEDLRPVDVIWAIDTSPSMIDEIGTVQQELTAFAVHLLATDLDFHLVVIGNRGRGDSSCDEFWGSCLGICIDEPVAGPDCGDSDRLRHVDVNVDSQDALVRILNTYRRWSDFLRDGSLRTIFVVTDDESRLGWADFHAELLERPGFDDYVFNAFCGLSSRDCPSVAAVGRQYVRLAAQTGGTAEPICTSDWAADLRAMGNGILGSVGRAFSLSAVPYDPTDIQVTVEIEGERVTSNDWAYDGRTNTIVGGSAARPGAHVFCSYGTFP
jgi:hypothetical protein